MKLTGRDIEVIGILMAGREAMTCTQIVNAGGGGITQSTAQASLRKLTTDGLVDVQGITHSGNVLSRTYAATAAARDAVLKDLADRYRMVSGAVSPEELMAAIREEGTGHV